MTYHLNGRITGLKAAISNLYDGNTDGVLVTLKSELNYLLEERRNETQWLSEANEANEEKEAIERAEEILSATARENGELHP